jgi:hypothetical protein
MKGIQGESKTAVNMLYLYEIVERSSERHFEGNHYVTAHKSKMNIAKNESGCNLVSSIHKVFKSITFITNDYDQFPIILVYFISSEWWVYISPTNAPETHDHALAISLGHKQ